MSKKPEQQGNTKPKEEANKGQNVQKGPTVQITPILEQPGKEKTKFPNLKDILEKHYSSPEQKEVVNERIQLLKKNDIFTFANWVKLTKETKDVLCNKTITEFPIPPVLRQILDEAAQGNSHIQIHNFVGTIEGAQYSNLESFFKDQPSDSNAIKLFNCISTFKVTIPTISYYSTTNKWIKPNSIPCFEEEMDFRLVVGDLDNPKGTNQTAKEMIENIERKGISASQNILFLLGISGCGKTKSIFDVAAKHYTIILDFSDDTTRSLDIVDLMEKIDTLSSKKDQDMNTPCRDHIFRTFLSRYFLLAFLMDTKQIKSPPDWLLLQLNRKGGEEDRGQIQSALKLIRHFLSKFDWDGMQAIFYSLKKMMGVRTIIAIDEANVLLAKHPDRFMDSDGVQNQRPLSSIVVSTLCKKIAYSLPLIISGTHMKIEDEKRFGSSAMKEEGSNFYKFNDFRCNGDNEVKLYLRRFVSFKDEHFEVLKSCLPSLRGRTRILTDFVRHVSKWRDDADITQMTIEWKRSIIEESKQGQLTSKSLFALINKYVQSNPSEWQLDLSDLIYAFFMKDGMIKVNPKYDYMAAGFCFFERNENRFHIAEPLVVEALVHYMKIKEYSIIEAMMVSIFKRNSPQEIGRLLDEWIALSLLLEQGNKVTFENLNFIGDRDMIPNWFNHKYLCENVFNIEKIDHMRMEDAFHTEWSAKRWILPTTTSGNDGAILGSIIVMLGDKTTLSEASVETPDVNSNFLKTSLEGLYKHETINEGKTKENESKRMRIQKDVKDNGIIGIIRIHCVFPKAPKTKQVIHFSPGIRILTNETIGVPEVIIDLDLSNLKNSNLFSPTACDYLIKEFNARNK
jgi:hypothetical protein